MSNANKDKALRQLLIEINLAQSSEILDPRFFDFERQLVVVVVHSGHQVDAKTRLDVGEEFECPCEFTRLVGKVLDLLGEKVRLGWVRALWRGYEWETPTGRLYRV